MRAIGRGFRKSGRLLPWTLYEPGMNSGLLWLFKMPGVKETLMKVMSLQQDHIGQGRGTRCSAASKTKKKMKRYVGSKRRAVVIHDTQGLKTFWEEIIEMYTKQKEDEDSRLHRSALNKLRHEWTQRLESQIKMLQKNSEDSKVQPVYN